MLTHLPKPLTRRYRTDSIGRDLRPIPMVGGGEGGQPHHRAALISHNAIFAVAVLLSALLVGLATVALR